jgi:hypothetical protein
LLADADLTTDESKILKGYGSRQVSVEAEWRSFSLLAKGWLQQRRVRRGRLGFRAWKFAFGITDAMAADEQEIKAGEETVNVRERRSITGVLRFATTF